jgi:hypothetical protein
MLQGSARCAQTDAPSGNRPLSPVSVFLPRNQPSPKSSSRSISSMRSPRLRLSSSGLRARNSWTTTSWSPGLHCSVWDRCMVATATMWWRGAVWGQGVGSRGRLRRASPRS